ncbi:S8 family serine peptidase [Peristeroidobacter agariperforans]|uniref:S8 family serine peptidase n=1 Tax=Peristeroidobacter agariperforans TaxID=268404 RepID=UPI00101DE046|nr:S8 family serine peptidase [Peristeroidobacter agariperforans]
MVRKQARLFVVAGAILVASCGGGGGGGAGGNSPPPTPTVSLSATPASLTQGARATLTWSSTNATSCTASNGWSGARAPSGTEEIGPITATTTYAIACSNNGGTPVSASAVVTFTAPPASVTLSGTITIPSVTQVDGDTNDDDATPTPNNYYTEAQRLPNPVVVGGYVNDAGAGEDGPSFESGDRDDYYRVNLLGGQVIELISADTTAGYLNMDLITSDRRLVDSSAGNAKVHQLTVPASGEYFIVVTAIEGAMNYNLAIGRSGSTAMASPLVLSREFVPGEVLVKTKSAAAGGVGAQKQSQVAGAYGLARQYGVPGMHALMKLSGQSLQVAAASKKPQVQTKESEMSFESEQARLKWQTLQMVQLLNEDPEVEWAEPNYINHALAVPNDPEYNRQRWHYEQISLPAAWDTTTGKPSVVVAVIDTGVTAHLDLTSRYVAGYDFVRGAGAGDGDDDDSDPRDPGTPSTGTYMFHGTHVAGTIAAAGNNGQGVTGVAWNASIMPIRVLGVNNSGSIEDIIQGILASAGLPNRSGATPAQRADIINLSLGGLGSCSNAYQDAINRARAAGVIVIAAAGNDNTDRNFAPASCNGVVSVSSVGVDRARAPYSNYGASVDVAAPGGDTSVDRNGDGAYDGIFSTYSIREGNTYYSSYSLLQGTSMAAPHVAGVAALMKSVNASLTPATFDSLLASGALTDDIGPAGPDVLGVGLINAAKAVRAAATTPPPVSPQLSVSPTSVGFGEVGTVNEVTVNNSGGGTMSVTGTTTSAAWLSVAPVRTGTNGLGTYRIQVNRTGLAAGTYNGWVEFRGSVGTAVRTAVLMQVAPAPAVPNAGQQYVLLIDSATGTAVDEVEVQARGASVDFAFIDVQPGTYELAAGTDMNNDKFICDEGEACAEYPLFGEATPIEVTADRTGLNMVTGFYSSPGVATAGSEAPPAEEKKGFRRLR